MKYLVPSETWSLPNLCWIREFISRKELEKLYIIAGRTLKMRSRTWMARK